MKIYHVDRLEFRFVSKPWAFALERRTEIDESFAKMQRDNPALWNGRVLLLNRHVLTDNVLSGDFLEADYASFSSWHRWGCPAAEVTDCFGASAIQSSDGAFLLGRMAAHTYNAGMIYFPSGTPDPSDVVGGKVDLDFSVRRELKEETGLDAAEFTTEPGWTVVADDGLIAMIKVLRSNETAEALRTRILANLARETQPEFSDIRIVRGVSDFDPAIPSFVTAFLALRFANA